MIPSLAINLIKEFEGLHLTAYRCPANVWTIGYGVTRLNGRPVRATDVLPSEAEAIRLLREQLERDYLPKLRIIPGWDEMTEGQQSALISFAWNLGPHFYGSQGFETITKALKARDNAAIARALLLYVRAGGHALPGLIARRGKESSFFAMTNTIDRNIELTDLDNATAQEIQRYLATLGYYDGPIDGIVGKNTAHGFASWKGDRWLEFPTIIGPGSYSRLKEEAANNPAIDWGNFSSRISKYFTVGEVAQGLRNGQYIQFRERIPTNRQHRDNAIRLAQRLDQVREEWGSALMVSSWYRPPAINRAVGGAVNSQHLNGSAVDLIPVRGDVRHFQSWLDARWQFALGYGAPRGFVHLDARPGKLRWRY